MIVVSTFGTSVISKLMILIIFVYTPLMLKSFQILELLYVRREF